MHVDTLLSYQADFGEELNSWLKGEESGEHQTSMTQMPDMVSPKVSPNGDAGSGLARDGGLPCSSLIHCNDTDLGDDSEIPSTSVACIRWGHHPH